MDDLISRQELLNDVEELRQSPWFNDDNYFAIRKDALSCVVDLCIKKAPSAQKKGHWIDTNPDEPLDPRQTCSECGNTEILHSAKFCPNCGADMRGEDDG